MEMSTFRIVIKLCIKYNVTIIEANNTCITSDNIIETKRNCHLSRHLNIENIGMFCNYLATFLCLNCIEFSLNGGPALYPSDKYFNDQVTPDCLEGAELLS